MSTSFDSSLLSGYLDGELDANETALVERVLEQHPERLRELESLRQLQRSLATLPTPKPTTDPVAAVRARIERNQPVAIESPRRLWLNITPFALAACLLLAAGWMMLGTELNPSRLVSDHSASPARGVESERLERLDRADSSAAGESIQFSQGAGQPTSAPQPPEALSQRLGGTVDQQEPRLLREQPQQEATTPPEPGAMRRRTLSTGATPERDVASPERILGRSARPNVTQPMNGADDASLALPFSAPGEALLPLKAEVAEYSLDHKLTEPWQLEAKNAVRLRYEVPQEEHAETVRWLRSVAPRELKEAPAVGDVKRYWFYGRQQEQQELQAAIKKRLEVTEGGLEVVQSADVRQTPDSVAAPLGRAKSSDNTPLAEKTIAADAPESSPAQSGARDESRGMTARREGSSDSDLNARPTAIIIELFAHPEE